MRKTFVFALGAILLACAGWTPSATAATEQQKLAAIQGGLAHLDYIQCKTAGSNFGSWASGNTSSASCGGTYRDAYTAMSVFAFMARVSNWPTGSSATYQADADNGIAYLLANASVNPSVSTNADGVNICPGGSGTCPAIYWNITNGEMTYATGFVAQAVGEYALTKGIGSVATSTGPLAGLTWTQIAQGITNAYAAAQQGSNSSAIYDGGWRYSIPATYGQADMSTTQWGAISAGYAESLGASTPSYLKAHLRTYLANSVTGATSGVACYLPNSCSIGPTFGENGGWLVSNSYAGQSFNATVVAWINTNWKSPANSYSGNFGHAYGMWATYKALSSYFGVADTGHQITNLLTDCGVAAGNRPGASAPSGGACTWWEDYNEWLVNGNASVPNSQITTDGGGNKYWGGYSSWGDPLSTAVNVSILEAAALPTSITTGGSPTTTIPTLSMWGLLALGILLAGAAAMKIRKAHAHRT